MQWIAVVISTQQEEASRKRSTFVAFFLFFSVGFPSTL